MANVLQMYYKGSSLHSIDKVFRPIKRFKSTNSDKSNDSHALANRFNEILNEQLSHTNKSILDKNVQDQITNNTYNSQYQNQLAYVKLENLLKYNKHAQSLVNATPWSGNESQLDANLRMILDLKPKPKKVNKLTRLANAKESSLDYKLNGGQQKPGDNFRELYKERFIGPTMLINTKNPNVTLSLSNSIADSNINSKINKSTGKFDDASMESVRGKPLDMAHLKNAQDSNYFMNQILNKQEVLPPWIENQQELDRNIERFRNDIDKMYLKYFSNDNPKETMNDTESNRIKSKFKFDNINYINERLNLINASVRSYNLQSPSNHLHKMKLIDEIELNRLFDRVVENYSEIIKALHQNTRERSISNSSKGLLNLFPGEAKSIRQRPVQKMNFWKSFKAMFQDIEPITKS